MTPSTGARRRCQLETDVEEIEGVLNRVGCTGLLAQIIVRTAFMAAEGAIVRCPRAHREHQ